jgi:hypothetical protein
LIWPKRAEITKFRARSIFISKASQVASDNRREPARRQEPWPSGISSVFPIVKLKVVLREDFEMDCGAEERDEAAKAAAGKKAEEQQRTQGQAQAQAQGP